MGTESETNNPVMTAREMTDALVDNTKALNRVSNRSRNNLIVLLVVVLVFGYGFYAKHNTEVRSCNSGNEVRAQINDKFASIADLIEQQTLAIKDSISDNTQEFLILLNKNFPVRDCGDIGWL